MERRDFIQTAAAVAALPAADASADSSDDTPTVELDTTYELDEIDAGRAIATAFGDLVAFEQIGDGWTSDVRVSASTGSEPHLDLSVEATDGETEIGAMAELDVEQARVLREQLAEAVEIVEAARDQHTNTEDA